MADVTVRTWRLLALAGVVGACGLALQLHAVAQVEQPESGLYHSGAGHVAGDSAEATVVPRHQPERNWFAAAESSGGGFGGGAAGQGEGRGGIRRVQREVLLDRVGEGDREGAWLGVVTEEAPDALAAQLKLQPGCGLVVTHVATNSPAAKAGIEKNDLLTEFDHQVLVHPSQLRKLVRVRKPDDSVEIVGLRGGEKREFAVKLSQPPAGRELLDMDLRENWGDLRQRLQDLPMREALREQMSSLKDSLKNLKVDQTKVQEELRRSLEEAQRALEQALRTAGASTRKELDRARDALKELEARQSSSVTVRKNSKNVRTVVKSDESGNIVVVWSPKPHLTAHDPDGKLIFDGPIATEEEKQKVPRELWERVEPVLKENASEAEDSSYSTTTRTIPK